MPWEWVSLEANRISSRSACTSTRSTLLATARRSSDMLLLRKERQSTELVSSASRLCS